jgi:REP element-mobilizing transposase RayT
MARKLRAEYPGAIYHEMNRGDRREPSFRDEEDRRCFFTTLGEACAKTGWQVHALCLMSNHFHLVVETPRGNLVAGVKWFLGTYTGSFNRRHKLFGYLHGGRVTGANERGCGQVGHRGTVAGGGVGDSEMDRGAIANGNGGARQLPVVFATKEQPMCQYQELTRLRKNSQCVNIKN